MLPLRAGLLAALVLVLVATVAACGDDDGASATGGLRVVATTTQAADLVRNVGGDRIAVTQLLSPNTDPHEYELRPQDVQALTDADVVVRSGGDVDDWLADAVEQSGSDADIVTLIDAMDPLEGGHEHEQDSEHGDEEEPSDEEEHAGEDAIDPHWWQDPRNAVIAVGEIEKALAAADPDGAKTYADSAARYRSRIEALDKAVAACWRDVPAAQRKLVTTHDALGYYAKRYGLEVIGTVIPSLSTQGQASAGDVAELVQTIKREGVNVVFAESSVNSKVEQAIADESGATVGKALWADTLGPEGSDGATYLASIVSNTKAMVDGVTGGAVTCSLPVD
jgi:zinc/manganese transport system substrate-binding protein